MTATTRRAPAGLAGALLFALPDAAGTTRRIALHPPSHYAIDDRWHTSSLMVGPPDGSVELAAPANDDPLAKLRFPHLGSWDARYLGYENLWMLLSHYPRETTRDGQGHRLALPGLAGQSRWLTVQRERGDDLVEPITAVGPDPAAAMELLRAWMRDRAAPQWTGGDEDPALGRTPLWVERDLGVTITLSRITMPADDPRALLSPTWWTVTRRWPRPTMLPLVTTRWFKTGTAAETAAAIRAFTGLVAGAGPHWR
ncbi:hypothetical protein K2Z83_15650 [Oscillochloris sp. ZM17-4]|uniref:hypothetical protein n=1 Tax=Oscillochloris sp. ZM17-4 TaxID=2866714 RepID=UPI001C73AFE3|nr:hypothetical protein [Oscillochloris sp. ZM17-4]MBX0329112.1 hypothetical protein [Oscillochloris sp. ZM17-4]